MPILIPADPAAPLDQGDLLELAGPLVGLGSDGNPELFSQFKMGLVISRECAGANGDTVLLAGVKPSGVNLDSGDDRLTALELRRQLQAHRDGGETPDSMYLGHLPGNTERLAAMLSMICVVALPKGAAREKWTRDHRVAKLAPEFVRALPIRLYWATARVGHDDEKWLPDADLSSLILRAEGDLQLVEEDLERARAKNELASLRRIQNRGDETRKLLGKLSAERDRRRQASGTEATATEPPPPSGAGAVSAPAPRIAESPQQEAVQATAAPTREGADVE